MKNTARVTITPNFIHLALESEGKTNAVYYRGYTSATVAALTLVSHLEQSIDIRNMQLGDGSDIAESLYVDALQVDLGPAMCAGELPIEVDSLIAKCLEHGWTNAGEFAAHLRGFARR